VVILQFQEWSKYGKLAMGFELCGLTGRKALQRVGTYGAAYVMQMLAIYTLRIS
jgi:hypothetical protein